MPEKPKPEKPVKRLYPLLVRNEKVKPVKKVRTYWSKYPELKLLKSLGKRRLISFVFFSYLFMFSTAEFTGNVQIGRVIIPALVMLIFLLTISVFVFDHGIKYCQYSLLIPFMTLVMFALSFYVCLFGMTAMALLQSPPFEWLLLFFHCFLFIITSCVLLTLLKATDLLWQGFFTLQDMSTDPQMLMRLICDLPIEDEPPVTQKNNKKKKNQNGPKFILIERRGILRK